MGFVYCLTSPSGKKYVGMTGGSVVDRWASHIRDARMKVNKAAIQNAIRKYGAENFQVETLVSSDDRPTLCALEKFWIDKLKTLAPNGYNLKGGGESGYSFTEEAKRNVSEGVIRSRLDPDVVRRHAEATKLALDTPEFRAKRSATSSEFWSDDKQRERQRVVMKAHWADGSRAKKYSERMKSTWEKEEYREKVKDALRKKAPEVNIEGHVYRSCSDAADALRLPAYTVSYRICSPLKKWKGWFNVKQ